MRRTETPIVERQSWHRAIVSGFVSALVRTALDWFLAHIHR
ncbi:hypothetical protein ACIRL2_41450 [Embleya sp. NPDC127516]